MRRRTTARRRRAWPRAARSWPASRRTSCPGARAGRSRARSGAPRGAAGGRRGRAGRSTRAGGSGARGGAARGGPEPGGGGGGGEGRGGARGGGGGGDPGGGAGGGAGARAAGGVGRTAGAGADPRGHSRAPARALKARAGARGGSGSCDGIVRPRLAVPTDAHPDAAVGEPGELPAKLREPRVADVRRHGDLETGAGPAAHRIFHDRLRRVGREPATPEETAARLAGRGNEAHPDEGRLAAALGTCRRHAALAFAKPDRIDQVSVCADALQDPFGQVDAEGLLEGEPEFDQIEGVGRKVVGEGHVGRQLFGTYAQLGGYHRPDPRLDGLLG